MNDVYHWLEAQGEYRVDYKGFVRKQLLFGGAVERLEKEKLVKPD